MTVQTSQIDVSLREKKKTLDVIRVLTNDFSHTAEFQLKMFRMSCFEESFPTVKNIYFSPLLLPLMHMSDLMALKSPSFS